MTSLQGQFWTRTVRWDHPARHLMARLRVERVVRSTSKKGNHATDSKRVQK